MIWKFPKDDSGATMVEYALLAFLIALGCVAAIQNLPGPIQQTFQSISAAL